MLGWQAFTLLAVSAGCWAQRNYPGSTPCPDVAKYTWDEEAMQWQGLITIIPPVQLSKVKLMVKMTVNYYPLDAGYGRIDVDGGEAELHAITRRVLNNERQTLRYKIDFPRGKPTPRITSVNINEKEFCPNSLTDNDVRANINLEYNMNTGVDFPYASGDYFQVAGAQPRPPNHAAATVPPHYEYPTTRPTTRYTTRPNTRPTTRYTTRPTTRPTTRYTTPPTTRPWQQAPTQEPDQETYNQISAGQTVGGVVSATPQCHIEPKEAADCLLLCEQLSDNLNSTFQRRDTIKAIFPSTVAMPSIHELQTWAYETLNLHVEDVDGFQIVDEYFTVFIKLKNVELGEQILTKTEGKSELIFTNGTSLPVILTFSGFGYRTVQIFNIPIEVPNQNIANSVNKYGPVVKVNDEYWNSTFVFKVKNGVRRISMYVERHIPSYILVENYKAFVRYEGQPKTCQCDVEELRGVCNFDSKSVNNPSLFPLN